jgi:hypothetical protein
MHEVNLFLPPFLSETAERACVIIVERRKSESIDQAVWPGMIHVSSINNSKEASGVVYTRIISLWPFFSTSF